MISGSAGQQATLSGAPKSGVLGLVPVANAQALADSDRSATEDQNNKPEIMGLAAHVRRCFEAAQQAKLDVEQRMLQNLRARRGEYDPETLAKIKMTGGSEIYMMLSASKARAATALLRDVFLANGTDKPWTVDPTRVPDIPQDMVEQALLKAGEMVQELQDMLGGPHMVPESMVEDVIELTEARTKAEIVNFARKSMKVVEDKFEDQLQEGGFNKALHDFTDDISTFPAAILKGPVVRNKPQLEWQTTNGETIAVTKVKPTLEWERVSPFKVYPAPGSVGINDGYFIELHDLRPEDLEAMIGVEAYSDEAIRTIIRLHSEGGLKEWTVNKFAQNEAEGKNASVLSDTTDPFIEAIQFWGPVTGKKLIEWGMDAKSIPDDTKTYHCEVWMAGNTVFKAVLNYDPLGRKPYFKASWEDTPGSFWGNAPLDLIRDCQTMCNNAARSLANNMAISSGPQVDVNVDRIAPGETVTSMYPWKVWQTKSDPFGATTPPVNFFQPNSNAAELMGIYEKFAEIADNVSGIPRYMTGDAVAGGAGRTASGLSMMLGNAGKSLKSVVANIDVNVLQPAIERLHYYNITSKSIEIPELKRTDIKIVARGARGLMVREQAQVRRNEFLNIVLSNQFVAGIVGEEAITELLRTMASGLDLDVDKFVPPPEIIRARVMQQRQQALQQQAMMQAQAAAQGGQPGGQQGSPEKVMPPQQNNTLPQGGGQVVNDFAPQRM